MGKHTPGPWATLPQNPWRVRAMNGDNVADALFGHGLDSERGKANARLIAAAPDLLAAAKAAEETIASVPAWRNTTGHNRLRAAIAAAEGE